MKWLIHWFCFLSLSLTLLVHMGLFKGTPQTFWTIVLPDDQKSFSCPARYRWIITVDNQWQIPRNQTYLRHIWLPSVNISMEISVRRPLPGEVTLRRSRGVFIYNRCFYLFFVMGQNISVYLLKCSVLGQNVKISINLTSINYVLI